MHMRPGGEADLKDFQIRQCLGQRGASTGVHDRMGLPGVAGILGEPLDEFLILVVHRHRQPGLGDLGEGRHHRRVIDARKPDSIVFVGGQLERRNPRRRQASNGLDPTGLADRAIQRHVDMGGALHPADLVGEHFGRGHRLRHVIRHVHRRGDAAGRRRARRSLNARPTDRGRGVHMAIDHARQDQPSGMIDRLASRRRGADANGSDGLAAHGHVALPQNLRRGDDITDKNPIERF